MLRGLSLVRVDWVWMESTSRRRETAYLLRAVFPGLEVDGFVEHLRRKSAWKGGQTMQQRFAGAARRPRKSCRRFG